MLFLEHIRKKPKTNYVTVGSPGAGRGVHYVEEEVLTLIEYMIRKNYKITVEEERHGAGLYIAFDDVVLLGHAPLAEMIDRSTSPRDIEAVDCQEALVMIERKYPDFPYVRAGTLKEGFLLLRDKIKEWEKYSREEQHHISYEISDIAEHMRTK